MPTALTQAEKHHPAKFSSPVLETIKALMGQWLGDLDPGLPAPATHSTVVETLSTPQAPPDGPWRIIDPFAGVTWIHRLARLDRVTFAGELEHDWASNHGHAGRTCRADAGAMPYQAGTFHAAAFSAVYPNRVRDHHDATDTSKRMTYTHQMQALTGDRTRKLHPRNTGAMGNRAYAAASAEHIAEILRVVIGGGLLFVNMSNSIGNGGENNAVEQWLNWLTLRRCWIREVRPVSTARCGFGANYDARVEHEVVIVAQCPPKDQQATLL